MHPAAGILCIKFKTNNFQAHLEEDKTFVLLDDEDDDDDANKEGKEAEEDPLEDESETDVHDVAGWVLLLVMLPSGPAAQEGITTMQLGLLQVQCGKRLHQ